MKTWMIDTVGAAGWATLTGGVCLQYGPGAALMTGGGLLLIFAVAAGLRGGARRVV